MGLLKPDLSIAGYRAMWHGFNSSVRLKLFHLYWCNSLSVWSKLQHDILIFGLVIVEIWTAVYTSLLQPVYPITSRKILRQEFPSQM